MCLSLEENKKGNKNSLSPFSSEYHRPLIQIASSFYSLNRKLQPAAAAALGVSLPPLLLHSNLALTRFLKHQPILLSFFFPTFSSFDIRSRRFCFRWVLIGGGARTIINLCIVACRGSFRLNQIAGTVPLSARGKVRVARSLLLASSVHGFAHCVVIQFRN